MNGIIARVKIIHKEGGTIAYMHESEFLEELGLPSHREDPNETFFNVGDTFNFDDDRYKVLEIKTKFLKNGYEASEKGISLHRVGEDGYFNFQITYVVENV